MTLIAADVAGAGAVARLNAFAEHLDAAIATADSAYRAGQPDRRRRGAQARFAIIDTAGFDPRQPKIAAVYAALAKIESVEPLGVAVGADRRGGNRRDGRRPWPISALAA